MKGKARQTKYAKKANQMMDKVIGKGNREKLNKAVGSLIGEGSPSAMVTKKTKGGAMTTGKTQSQQAKELKRQQEMRKKYGTMAPMEPVQKKAMGGGMKQLLGTVSPAYGMATGEGAFGESIGVMPAIAKEMRNKRKKGDPTAPAEPAKPMKKGGKVKYCADGCAIKGKTRARMK